MKGVVMMRRYWLAVSVLLWSLLVAMEADVKGGGFEFKDEQPSLLDVYRLYAAGHWGVGLRGVELGVRSTTGVSLALLSIPWSEGVTVEWGTLPRFRYQFSWEGNLHVGVMANLAVVRFGMMGFGARSLLMWGFPARCEAHKFEALVPSIFYNWVWRPYPNFPRPCVKDNHVLTSGVGATVALQWSGLQVGATAWILQRNLVLSIPADLIQGRYPPDPPPWHILGFGFRVTAYVEIGWGRGA